MIDPPPLFDVVLVPWVDCVSQTVTVDVVLRSQTGEPAWCHALDLVIGFNPQVLRVAGDGTEHATVGATAVGVPGLGLPLTPWDFRGVNWSLDDGGLYFMWLAPLTGASNPTMVSEECVGSIVFDIIDPWSKTNVTVLPQVKGDAGYIQETNLWAGTSAVYEVFDGSFNAPVATCLPWWMVVNDAG